MRFYIDKGDEKALKEFKYSGVDKSLLYKYFASPLAEMMVRDYTPLWIHPNVITISGFLLVLVSHIIMVYYAPTFETGEDIVPNWVWIFCGLMLFVYHTMDNMDGKQARRTGSSSPLGLICDHGCDSLNAFITSLSWAVCVGFPLKYPYFFAIFISFLNGTLPFYTSTWEEYYIGRLELGLINGANEGVFLAISFFIVTGIYGQSIWDPFRYYLLFGAIPGVITSIVQIINVISYTRSHGQSTARALLNLYPIVSLLGLSSWWMYLSPNLLISYPRTFYGFMGAIFFDMTTNIMLKHILNKDLVPWRLATLPLYVGVLNAYLGYPLESYISEASFLSISTALITVKCVHFAIFVALEVKEIMHIGIFRIIEKPKDK